MTKICIDPGHGGYDPGAIGPTKLRECDVNLSVAFHLVEILHDEGIVAVLTRSADCTRTLYERAEISNMEKATHFISIHCNGYVDPDVHGMETYYYPGSHRGFELARPIHDALVKQFPANDNRHIKTAAFTVLANTYAPACLIELEFITNPASERCLRDAYYQRECAEAIANGIIDAIQPTENM